MPNNNTIEVSVIQHLDSGKIEVKANQGISFAIMLRMFLVALKGMKESILERVQESERDDLLELAFPKETEQNEEIKAYLDQARTLPLEQFKEDVSLKVEGEMYDVLNIAVSNFLDEEFPRVNKHLSLTEEAARRAGLDRSATEEELVQAENDLINDDPEFAAQTQEMQPTEIKDIN